MLVLDSASVVQTGGDSRGIWIHKIDDVVADTVKPSHTRLILKRVQVTRAEKEVLRKDSHVFFNPPNRQIEIHG